MPVWTQPPHWADRVVYVPAAELAECAKHVGDPCKMADGSVRTLTADMLVNSWTKQNTVQVDAYVLENQSGQHSAGVRYGDGGPDYLSLYCDQPKLEKLLAAYRQPNDQPASYPR